MNVFDEIQTEILSAASLSMVLRKAKVLAYRLKNQEFKDWIEHELNGYQDADSLPDYRKLSTHSNGNFLNSAWKMTDAPIPTNNIPREIREIINEVNMHQGVKELEALFKTYRINIKPRRLGSIHASSPFKIPLNSPLSLRNRRRHIACLTQSKLSPDLAHYTLMKLYSEFYGRA